MRKISTLLLAIPMLATTVFFISSTAIAQNNEEMKAMMAYATPGEVHKLLASSVGTWTCDVTIWMQPGAAPMKTTSETKNEMILGGRYLQGTNNGTFSGQPFQGISTTAYDNAKKLFINTWIDNMGTGMVYLTGTWDDQHKCINFAGTMVDPSSGKDMPIREVMKFIDPNTQMMEMYVGAGSKEFKNMEIKFTKK